MVGVNACLALPDGVVVRAMSDPPGFMRRLLGRQILLSTVFFLSAILYVRPQRRSAQRNGWQS